MALNREDPHTGHANLIGTSPVSALELPVYIDAVVDYIRQPSSKHLPFHQTRLVVGGTPKEVL